MVLVEKWNAVCLWILAVATFAVGGGSVAHAGQAASDQAVVESLLRLGDEGVKIVQSNDDVHTAVNRYLDSRVGTRSYLDVVSKLELTENAAGLAGFLKPEVDSSLQAEAIRLLVREDQLEVLRELLAANDATSVSVVNGLGLVNNQQSREMLKGLVTSKSASGAMKIAAASGLVRANVGQEFLLKLARDGELPKECKFPAYNGMMSSRSEAIRTEAERLLKPEPTTSGETLPPTRQLVRRRGDAKVGKQIFNTKGTCANCHKVHGAGKDVGPDLSEIGSKLSREAMYVAILNPNAGISHNYEQYALLTVDGLVLNGLLVTETDDEITLKTAEGVERTTAQDDVEEFIKRDVSLMPENLHKTMSVQELIDLVDYLVLLKKEDQKGFNALGKAAKKKRQTASRDAGDATSGIDVADGLSATLFSSEPQLFNPSNLDVDHLGRVWVCEVVNYRHFRNPNNEPREEGDRILVLEDRDGDGQPDEQTVFYQGRDIDSAHGICVLGNRAIVSAGDTIMALIDTDGDLKADEKQLLFTGISGVDHDHGVHAVTVGPDGKLYFNFGNEGRQLKDAQGNPVIDSAGREVDDSGNPYRQGMVFRCDPDGSHVETLAWNFRNSWELALDSFGTIWQSDNDDDGNRATRINYVMPFGNYGYLDELTGDRWTKARTGMHDEVSLRHWHLRDPGVVPNVLQTGAGSPCGIMKYEGTLLPAKYQNQLIHCDAGPNSVRSYQISDDGAGYRATQHEVATGTRDRWFRPVDVAAAPDGSLFVADWYDPGVGGHRMGDTQRGRIFRIAPTDQQGQYQTPAIDFSTPQGAVQALCSPNVSTRYLAAEALRAFGRDAEAELSALLKSGDRDELRARALWVLGRLDAGKYVPLALSDSSANIRIVGIRIALQEGLPVAEIAGDVVNDPSPQVRRELAIALHADDSEQADGVWAQLARNHPAGDRWHLEALGIGAAGHWSKRLAAWRALMGEDWDTDSGREIVWRSRAPEACGMLAEIVQSESTTASEQLKYFRAFDFHPEGDSKREALTSIVGP